MGKKYYHDGKFYVVQKWINTSDNILKEYNYTFKYFLIYALSADETSPALAVLRHAIIALFSCCFKCPLPFPAATTFLRQRRQSINTLHFASKVVCQGASPLWKVWRVRNHRIFERKIITHGFLIMNKNS